MESHSTALAAIASSSAFTAGTRHCVTDMVGEAIEKRTGEPFRTEHQGPFVEWQVAGHESGAAFVTLAEDLEEQFRTNRRERHVAQLIDDQQFDRVEMFLQRPQATFVAR